MPTDRQTTMTNAASVRERGLLTIPGRRRREADMFAQGERFITSAIHAEQPKQAVMRHPLNMISAQAVTKNTVVHGRPTVLPEEHMSGTDIITLCVQDVRRLTNTNGALCIAEIRQNCHVRIKEEGDHV